MIKAIIFDYDGVIVDSFGGVFDVYKTICQHFKVFCPKTIDEFRVTYGYNYIECLNNLGIKEKNFVAANLIFNKEIVKKEFGVFDEIPEIITKLAKKYKIYLVSASYSKEIYPRLKKFNLINFFEKIYCGADQKIPKSELMKNLLAENNYLSNEVVSIGDRAIDYEATKKVGIADDNIIMVNYGWGLDKSKIAKAKIAENPNEIFNLVNLMR